jgi:hypothetical protein
MMGQKNKESASLGSVNHRTYHVGDATWWFAPESVKKATTESQIVYSCLTEHMTALCSQTLPGACLVGEVVVQLRRSSLLPVAVEVSMLRPMTRDLRRLFAFSDLGS